MPKLGILKTSPPVIPLISLEEVGRNTTHPAQGWLIKGDQPKQGGNVTAHTWSWDLEWGWYGITKEMIWNICGSEPGLRTGVAPPGMYIQ